MLPRRSPVSPSVHSQMVCCVVGLVWFYAIMYFFFCYFFLCTETLMGQSKSFLSRQNVNFAYYQQCQENMCCSEINFHLLEKNKRPIVLQNGSSRPLILLNQIFTSSKLQLLPVFSPFSVVRPTQIFGIFRKKQNKKTNKQVMTQLNHFSLEIKK